MTQGQADKPILHNRCVGNISDTTVYHAVNLAVLNTFYDITNVTITGQSLLRSKEKLSLDDNFKLPIFGDDDIDQYLAADESISYSLRKLSRSLENDTVIYHSVSEALIDRYLTSRTSSTFWGIDKFTLLTIGMTIILAFLLILFVGTVKNKRVLRDLSIQFAGIHGLTTIPQAKALNLKSEFLASQQSVPNKTIINWNEELLKHLHGQRRFMAMDYHGTIDLFQDYPYRENIRIGTTI